MLRSKFFSCNTGRTIYDPYGSDPLVLLSGCPRDWGELPKPGKPMIVGIDGGYVRNWDQKNSNFEVIAGKSFSTTQPSKRFGFVQNMDDHPQRRLMSVLEKQGMQANQQITFLSDDADNVRDIQYYMYSESEHVLDWFHVTMKLTVLNQFAKGMAHSDPDQAVKVTKALECQVVPLAWQC